MSRDDHIAFIVQALRTAAETDQNMVQFFDVARLENWVRVWDFGHAETVHLDVTNRAEPGSPLPALNAQQIDALVALGLGPEARPDFSGTMQGASIDQIAARVEAIFDVLDSDPNCELVAAMGSGQWKPPNPMLLDVYGGIRRSRRQDG